MPDERLEVSVTFDEPHGYIASTPELRHPIVALSLASLRKRIEIALLPDDVRVVLHLDGLAERERHRRRAQAWLSRIAQLDQRTAPPGPMSALGGSGRAAPKEEVRVWSMLWKKSQTALRLISRRKTNHATIVRRYAPRPVTDVTGEFIAL